MKLIPIEYDGEPADPRLPVVWRAPLRSDTNLCLVELRTPWQRWRDRFGELAADVIEFTLTLVGTVGVCLACLALLILGGYVP